jgi:cell division protein FtsW
MDTTRGLFLSLAAVLLGCGLLTVHSASVTSWPTETEQVYLSRHALFALLGVAAGAACAAVPSRVWFRLSPWLFAGTVLLLVAVLVPGLGTMVNGARRWLRWGGVSLQPSELAKIALPLLLSRLAVARAGQLRHWLGGTLPFAVPAALVVGLVLVEPDLGTAAFLAVGAGLCLFLAGWPLRNFLVAGVVAVAAVFVGVGLKPYQLERVTGFVAAWTDWDAAPYQVRQSLMTLGAGGVSGVGIGKGWQKLSFLPEANTDFVFAVVGEELGLVGTLALVAVWGGLYFAGLRLLARRSPRSFGFVAGTTLLTQLTMQAALNVAVVTAMVPPKGIAHPLLSYGGSNLVTSLVALGLVLSLSQADERTV